ncbi:MAG TPA: hypothetical protein VGS96_18505 [Thermoanaerobaculia bacterium]|jgi:hypothetical protein|nr:hypothetical protein [Thermoanaerobaculia bacterium]
MTISVQKINLWRAEMEDQPGTLASVIEELAHSGADVEVVMGYSYPAERRTAVIEVFPVTSPRTASVAQQAGLSRSSKPTLLIQGDDRVGLSDVFYRAIADAGLNIDFVVAQAVGAHFSVVVGFATESDSDRAAKLIKEVAREWERSGGAHDTPN